MGDVKSAIIKMHQMGKPIVALCMGPTVLAKALEGSDVHASLTVGSTEAASPYEIDAISEGMEKIGRCDNPVVVRRSGYTC